MPNREGSLALIDLADFNNDGSLKYHSVARGDFNPRSMNIGRTFEHEFFGHGEKGYRGGRYYETYDNVPYVNSTFRDPAGIPARRGYGDSFSNGSRLNFNPTKALIKKGKKIMYNKIFR